MRANAAAVRRSLARNACPSRPITNARLAAGNGAQSTSSGPDSIAATRAELRLPFTNAANHASSGARPTLAVHDVATQPLPLATGSVHLVSMTSVLHLFDDPFPVLAEVHRLLAPTGLFMLHDWIRRPLPDYLAWNRESSEDAPDITRQRGLRLFPVHNKYTTADWQWLLHEADFAVLRCGQLRPTHRMFVAIPTGS